MSRDAGQVPCAFIDSPEGLVELEWALAAAERVAIDTETVIGERFPGDLRVVSVAVRNPGGHVQSFVVDNRDVDPTLLAPLFAGVTADAWNAHFDALVLDRAIWNSDDVTDHITWWDALLADALLWQGRSGFGWFHGLAWATEHYLGIKAEGKGTIQLSYDATSDLTPDQIAYAAADAVHTLWVADEIRHRITTAGLDEVCDIELSARPFLDQMQRTGLGFDWGGWKDELNRLDAHRREVVTKLALLTGGGQGSLFDTSLEPSWNPASDPQVRTALNRHAPDQVAAWTTARYGEARELTTFDSVTAGVLAEIGGELCQALLEFRNLTKVLSTYGESIHDHLHDDGRLRPQYVQVVGTNTGRLASRDPNAQNFTPKMKPFFRPGDGRVFVYADLSQAELRFLAQVAKDEPLRAAFARGDDVHVSTAASMFGFDPARLEAEDPGRFKHLRQIAKALNFGIAYGAGAAALARSLTAEGTPTTRDEAERLLAAYRRTYPGTAAWAQDRIAEIGALSSTTDGIDWTLTLRLARGFAPVAQLRRELREGLGRWPDAVEIAEAHPDRISVPVDELAHEIGWLLQYPAPVALVPGGEPFTFASRTLSGRRQQFNLHLDRLFLVATLEALTAPAHATSAGWIRVRQRFEAEHGLPLGSLLAAGDETALARQFDDRPLRRLYIEAVAAELGEATAYGLLTRAAADRVSAMVNAWRNAPIQGGVADIMLVAYADLHRRLRAHPSARPVQTVHDSITIECAEAEAEGVAMAVRAALEEASLRYCPDVAPKADIDIRTTLADDSVLAGM